MGETQKRHYKPSGRAIKTRTSYTLSKAVKNAIEEISGNEKVSKSDTVNRMLISFILQYPAEFNSKTVAEVKAIKL